MTEIKTHEHSTRKEVLENFVQLLTFPNTVHGDNGYSFFYGKVEGFEIVENIPLIDGRPFKIQVDLYLSTGNIKTFYAGVIESNEELSSNARKMILPILKDASSPVPTII